MVALLFTIAATGLDHVQLLQGLLCAYLLHTTRAPLIVPRRVTDPAKMDAPSFPIAQQIVVSRALTVYPPTVSIRVIA